MHTCICIWCKLRFNCTIVFDLTKGDLVSKNNPWKQIMKTVAFRKSLAFPKFLIQCLSVTRMHFQSIHNELKINKKNELTKHLRQILLRFYGYFKFFFFSMPTSTVRNYLITSRFSFLFHFKQSASTTKVKSFLFSNFSKSLVNFSEIFYLSKLPVIDTQTVGCYIFILFLPFI